MEINSMTKFFVYSFNSTHFLMDYTIDLVDIL